MSGEFSCEHQELNSDELLELVERLAQRQIDKILTDAERDQLAQLIVDNERACNYYTEYMHDTWQYHALANMDSTEVAARRQALESSSHQKRRHVLRRVLATFARPKPLSITLAALVIGLLITAMAFMAAPYYRQLTRLHRGEVVGQLTGAHEAQWASMQAEIGVGAPLGLGQSLSLERGLAEVTLADGAIVTLNGPCQLTLTGANAASLHQGAIAAWVGRQAQGFAVTTPSAKVVDLGTEFGVDVDDGQATSVEVFQGSVQLKGTKEDKVHELTAGMRARLTAGGVVALNSAAPQREFVRQLPKFDDKGARETVAYLVARGAPGKQDFSGALGMDFVVRKPIEVTRLGAYDNGGNGFKRTITVELWQRDEAGTPDEFHDDHGGAKLASLTFSPEDAEPLAGSSRFQLLDEPLRLAPGAYTIVAQGYGAGELACNETIDPASRQFKTRHSGQGAIEFVGTSRFGEAGQFPTTAARGDNPQCFAAGTFAFRVLNDE